MAPPIQSWASLWQRAFLSASPCSKMYTLAACTIAFAALLHLPGIEAQPISVGDTRLDLVQVVFRHGNRTPQFPYYNDPNSGETFEPYGWDQLDAAGRQRAYDLGRYLKRLYGSFIGDEYIPGVVNITTTHVPRTKMSAQAVAAGLFPPTDAQKWGPRGGLGDVWQPITFNYLPIEEDDLLFMTGVPCPAFDEEKAKVDGGPVHEAVLQSDPELVDAVVTNARIERSVLEIERLHQIVRVEVFYDLPMADWLNPFYPDRFIPFGIMRHKLSLWTRKMQRLYGGPLLKHMIEQMELRKGEYPLKMWMYSAHDDTVAWIGMTIRAWGDLYVDFSNAIIIELRADSAGNRYVQVLFHNDTSKLPMVLTVEGCEELCPFEKFKSILSDSVPGNRWEECEQRSNGFVAMPALTLLLTLFIAGRTCL